MKKAILVMVICIGTLAFAQDKSITYNELPKTSQNFITNNFDVKSIQQITVDNDITSKDYEVYFSNGTKLEFDSKGVWKEIDGKSNAVSPKFISKKMQTYLTANYPNTEIKKIERDSKKIEVKLSNGLELKFDKAGNFIKIDD